MKQSKLILGKIRFISDKAYVDKITGILTFEDAKTASDFAKLFCENDKGYIIPHLFEGEITYNCPPVVWAD